MNLRTLSHDEFLKYADSQIVSELEREMLRRLDDPGFDPDLLDAIQDGTLDAQKMRDFLCALDEYEIETPDDLRTTVDRGYEYAAVASDYGCFSPEELSATLDKSQQYVDAAKEHDIESPQELIDALHQWSNQNHERKEA